MKQNNQSASSNFLEIVNRLRKKASFRPPTLDEITKEVEIVREERYAKTSIRIDPSLDQHRDKVLFPAKLAKANEMLKTAKLPAKRHHS